MHETGPRKRAASDRRGHKKHRADSSPTKNRREKTIKAQSTPDQRIEVIDWNNLHRKNQTKTAQHFDTIYPELNIKKPLVSKWIRKEVKILKTKSNCHNISTWLNSTGHP